MNTRKTCSMGREVKGAAGAKRKRWTILEVLRWASEYFAAKGIPSSRTEAEVLLAHALKLKRLDLYLRYDQPLEPEELKLFRDIVKRKISREPSQYITGCREFWSLDFEVGPSVLIPRPETEILVEKAVECVIARGYRNFLEIGTGSGAVVISVLKEVDTFDLVVATDISTEALVVARRNAERHKVVDRLCFVGADLFTPFRKDVSFDIIVSNPPYISPEDYQNLPPEIKDYEPSIALLGGDGGLEVVKKIIVHGWERLSRGGMMLIEIGHDQVGPLRSFVQDFMSRRGSESSYIMTVFKDYGGFDRVVCIEHG